eukprot:gene7379-biopygen22532
MGTCTPRCTGAGSWTRSSGMGRSTAKSGATIVGNWQGQPGACLDFDWSWPAGRLVRPVTLGSWVGAAIEFDLQSRHRHQWCRFKIARDLSLRAAADL